MSKPRYKWWGYVKNIIRAYPQLKAEYEYLHSVNITANLSGMPSSRSISRNTENSALCELPKTQQREYDAVTKAIEITKRSKLADDILSIVDLVYWKNSHTLYGAAIKANVSYETAKIYQRKFIMLVAQEYGLLDSTN